MIVALRRASWLGFCALVACSSQDGDPREGDGAFDHALEQECRKPAPVRLTPSNLPADICDAPGSGNLTVAAGTSTTIDPNAPCDVLVPQADGLPPICVHKYANVSIGGDLLLKAHAGAPRSPTIAIVATKAFAIESGATIDARGDYLEDPRVGREGPGAADARGAPQAESGHGAGHVTPGGGLGEGSVGGPAFGPTTGTQLVAGSTGANGAEMALHPGGLGGRAGGAVQLVSCGELRLAGTVTASGTNGFNGEAGVTYPSQGGGGGSGGTLVVEAARITGSGASLTAVGGSGGAGGPVFGGGPVAATPPCAGGAGGTGASAPQPAGEYAPGSCAPGGGGGSIGRIVINVPKGVSLPAIAADPPAAIGVVGTH